MRASTVNVLPTRVKANWMKLEAGVVETVNCVRWEGIIEPDAGMKFAVWLLEGATSSVYLAAVDPTTSAV